jgi:transposase
MREAAMEKTRQALEKRSMRVAAGRLKKAQKIGEAAARILGRNHGSRYYGWSFEKGIFRYFEHPGHLAPEKALEGKYVIQTEELDLSAVQAVEAYKDLSEIERSFRQLKDLVEMRPIYHRRPKRVRAHTLGVGGLLATYFWYASIQFDAISRWAVFQIQLAGAYGLVELPLSSASFT